MPLKFNELPEYVTQLKGDLAKEKKQMKDMSKSFNLEWGDKARLEGKDDNIKVTISPSIRNKTLGGVRLLTTTEPSFSIPKKLNTKAVMEHADDVERIAKRLLSASNSITNNTAEYDLLLSIFIYGQAQYSITRTKDLLANAQGKEGKRRFEGLHYKTPVLIDVYDPISGYVDRDRFGVRRYYREVEMTARAVADEFNYPAILDGNAPESTVVLCQLWTWTTRWVWIKGETDPILDNEIAVFPIGQTLGEGSTLFSDNKHHGQPFAYGLWESGMWQRQNLAWTATMTILYNLMLNANFLNEANSSDEYAERPSNIGGDILIPSGGKYSAMDVSKLLPPQLFQIMDMLGQEVDQSTIYGQTLGQPLGKGDAFAKVALLHQAGRLPLSMFSRKGAHAIAEVMTTAMRWIKDDPPTDPVYEHIFSEFNPRDIPDHYHMEAKLEVGLPQDSLESARVFGNLTNPKNPGASREWGMENILKIKQPKDEMRRIFKEQALDVLFQEWLSEKQLKTEKNQETLKQVAAARQQIQQKQQQAQKQGQAQTAPPPGGTQR